MDKVSKNITMIRGKNNTELPKSNEFTMDPSKYIEYELELGTTRRDVNCEMIAQKNGKEYVIKTEQQKIDGKFRFKASFERFGYKVKTLRLSYENTSKPCINHSLMLKGVPKTEKNVPEVFEFKPRVNKEEVEDNNIDGHFFDFIDKVDVVNENKKASISVFIVPVVILIVAFILGMLCSDVVDNGSIKSGHSYRTTQDFNSKMSDMRSLFPNQHPLYLRMLTNSGKRQLKRVWGVERDNLRPMSFLIVSYKEASNTIECFIQKLAYAYTFNSYNVIDSKNFQMKDARLQLDTMIKKSLDSDQKLVVVKNIEKLSFDAAQLFMTYSDEHNNVASYPQSTILLSINVPFESTGDRKVDEKRVSKFLQDEVWGDESTVDNKAALWTRIGDGIVVVQKERFNPCDGR